MTLLGQRERLVLAALRNGVLSQRSLLTTVAPDADLPAMQEAGLIVPATDPTVVGEAVVWRITQAGREALCAKELFASRRPMTQ